jgi:hypothetical protein
VSACVAAKRQLCSLPVEPGSLAMCDKACTSVGELPACQGHPGRNKGSAQYGASVIPSLSPRIQGHIHTRSSRGTCWSHVCRQKGRPSRTAGEHYVASEWGPRPSTEPAETILAPRTGLPASRITCWCEAKLGYLCQRVGGDGLATRHVLGGDASGAMRHAPPLVSVRSGCPSLPG